MKFWDKVQKCKHKSDSDYYRSLGSCMTPLCGSIEEYHCSECGVYITGCQCGTECGMSGWSAKMRKTWGYRMREIARRKDEELYL